MLLLFIHGWSVTNTSTYGKLPRIISRNAHQHNLDIEIKNIWLGRYISFHDEVTMTDIVRAMHQALHEIVPEVFSNNSPFSCITHSTGGPVVREWVDRYYGKDNLDELPLKHLIMLAPANHGSSLATLGKERIGRIKSWFNGVEPGRRILDWLSLGSSYQYRLAAKNIHYKNADNGYFPFVFTGQSIDEKYYDFLNSYLTEVGSDGVVRVSGANMNYSMLELKENIENQLSILHRIESFSVNLLEQTNPIMQPDKMPLCVIPKASHSGTKMGILKSPTYKNADKKPVVEMIFKALKINDKASYVNLEKEIGDLTKEIQSKDKHSKKHRYSNIVFSIWDDEGNTVENYDLVLLYGKNFEPEKLPKGFFVDKQRNTKSTNNMVFYLDYDVLAKNPDGMMGIRIFPRPSEGFSYYKPVEYRDEVNDFLKILQPNETLYVKIILHRHVDKNSFRFGSAEDKAKSFKKEKPDEGGIKY